MSLLRFLSKDIISAFGLEVRRVPRVAELGRSLQSGDPVTFDYMPSLRGAALLAIPLADTRGLGAMGLPLDPASHPHVRAALAARRAAAGDPARCKSVVREVLAPYYRLVRPGSALAALDLDGSEARGFGDVAAMGWLYPWAGKTVAQTLRGRRIALAMDALQYGRRLSVAQGLTAFGPVGPNKLTLEVTRICRLVRSVSDNGFTPYNRKSPLRVTALRRDGDYRWLVETGHHRFAVAASFSIDSLPALVNGVVRREDAGLWPQVVAGRFTTEGALRLFDRIWDGQPSGCCADWLAETGRGWI